MAESPTKPAAKTAQVKTLRCTNCAGPIELRAVGQTQRVACAYCGSILDATHPELAIVQKFDRTMKYQPLIPLGRRGELRGEKMECVGMLRRRVTVEGVNYEWSEYLLWNPYKGYRYLAEYQGHWNYIKIVHVVPVLDAVGGRERAEYLGKTYDHFQTCRATVVFVVGEFPWQVQSGEQAMCSDFVHPPYTLTRETSEGEVTWSIGEYISPEQVWKAFSLGGSPREQLGVAPSQPWPYEARWQERKRFWGWYMLAALLLEIGGAMASQSKPVHTQDFSVAATDVEKARVTEVFELTGRTSNVEVELNANVSNNWVYLAMALINEETGDALDFGREVSYYEGYDSDGRWTEGNRTDECFLPSVPPGRYYMRLEPEAGAYPVSWTVKVTRDVPLYRHMWLVMLLLSVPPIWLWYRRRSFEYQRWLESDHPMDPLIKFGESDDD